MTTPEKEKDFSQKAGLLMTTLAWLVFVFFLVWLFQGIMDKRNNPNQDITAARSGGRLEVTLQRNPQGHYISDGEINHQPVVFLLDTGATDVAIPLKIAQQLGLKTGMPIQIKTANGTSLGYRTRLQSISLGGITMSDLPATILSNINGDEVLLGMSFLKNFELIQKGRTLTVRQ